MEQARRKKTLARSSWLIARSDIIYMMRKAIRWMVKNEPVVFIVTGVIFLRVPSLFEPYWNPQEIQILASMGGLNLMWLKVGVMVIAALGVGGAWYVTRKRIMLTTAFALFVGLPVWGGAGGYYANFWAFVTGTKNAMEYVSWFGDETVRTYELVRAVAAQGEEDTLMVWPAEQGVYLAAGARPTTDIETQPKYVIVDQKEEGAKQLIADLQGKYILEKEWCSVSIFRRMGGRKI